MLLSALLVPVRQYGNFPWCTGEAKDTVVLGAAPAKQPVRLRKRYTKRSIEPFRAMRSIS